MFTGIVEEVGRIITADRKGNSARLKIEAEKVLEDIDWRSSGGKSGEPGTCDGGKRQIWRSYRDRTY